MGVDWPEIACLMEVSVMFNICRYCIFTWYGRGTSPTCTSFFALFFYIFQMWSLAAVSSNPDLKYKENPDLGAPWAKHPFGRQLLKSL